MKRTFILLMAALLFLPACTQEIRTETLAVEEEIPFHEGSDNNLSLNLNIDFPTAGFPQEALAEIRKAVRVNTLGEEYADFTGSVAELGQAWRNKVAEEYVASNEEMLRENEMSEEDAPFLNWGYDYNGSFGESYKNYVNYFIVQYQYLGGAHGMNVECPLVFDRKTGRIVGWETFAPSLTREQLCALLDQHKYDGLKDVIDENDLDEENIFYVETIEPSRWFSVGEEGLTFYYQPYDLAPYVFGVITIPVPWEELK
ncbi:MAG: DUF3298 domain-containing protein [Bacteroidales bacterium]|nr:DUF3298 domain-containing protein [Bacteroidales bacterium]MBR6423906.1 DUF3298 domain-containing protein [Bacteroidales bacterium]